MIIGRPVTGRRVTGCRVGESPYFIGSEIFKESDIGFLYLPSIRESLFQLADGTLPVTADGQPVGLMYDMKRGFPQLGPSLTLLTTSAAKASDGTSTTNILATDGIVGATVQVSFTVTGITGTFVVKSTATGGTSVTISANGTYSILVQAGATGGFIVVEGVTTSRFMVTGLVIKQLPGTHSRMSTLTSRPTYRTSPARLVWDLTDDAHSCYLPAITNGTLILAGVNGIWIDDAFTVSAGTFTIGPTTYTGGPSGLLSLIGASVGRLAINRQLTASEKAQLVAYFKSLGSAGLITLGPELVINGSFDTDTNWNKPDPSVTISGGNLIFTNTPSTLTVGGDAISPPPYAGRKYIFELNLLANSSFVRISWGGTTLTSPFQVVGKSSGITTATSANANPKITAPSAGITATVTSVSIREVIMP